MLTGHWRFQQVTATMNCIILDWQQSCQICMFGVGKRIEREVFCAQLVVRPTFPKGSLHLLLGGDWHIPVHTWVKKVLFVKVTCLYISTGQWDGLVLALVPPLPNLLGHAAVGQNSTPRKLGKDDISLQICCFGKNVLDVHWFLPS